MTKHKPALIRDPEVQPSSTRSTWTATQKLALLAEYEAFPRGSAARGAFLRRNGRYTSHRSQWRALRDRVRKLGLLRSRAAPRWRPKSRCSPKISVSSRNWLASRRGLPTLKP
jgi:hypothetical protein